MSKIPKEIVDKIEQRNICIWNFGFKSWRNHRSMNRELCRLKRGKR